MNGYITEKKISGVLTAVVRYGQIVHSDCLGLMDIETKKTMQPDTIFRIQSMTKPITAVGALILYEAGKLRFDDPVSKYIPEFSDTKVFVRVVNDNLELANLERPITIYDLFTHTSGLDYWPPEPLVARLYEQADLTNPSQKLSDWVGKLTRLPLSHQPGKGWTYGRSYDVLGHVIEIVADTSLDQYFDEKVLQPLGMHDTFFYVPENKLDRLATEYAVSEGGDLTPVDSASNSSYACQTNMLSGGGGLLSTLQDYLRFAQMLLNQGHYEGKQYLTKETVNLMTRNHLTGSLYPLRFGDWESKGEGYGLGVGVIVNPGESELAGSKGAYTWSGGSSTHFWVDSAKELIGLLMAQFQPMFYYPLHREFRTLVYQAVTN